MRIFLILVILFGLSSVNIGEIDIGCISIIVGVLSLLSLEHYDREKEKRDEFIAWMKHKRALLERGHAYYYSHRIDRNTKLISYRARAAFIVPIDLHSRYYFPDEKNDIRLAKYEALIISLLLGWWGTPVIVIDNFIAIGKILMGGNKTTVGDEMYIEHTIVNPWKWQIKLRTCFNKVMFSCGLMVEKFPNANDLKASYK
ncbi:MAG: hypothetical protein ACM3QW_05245 [Ignavibacteriales bacterium]